MQNDFQIVNHEIEHDTNLLAAIRIWGKTMRFDETRMGQSLFQRVQNGIEPFHVADLQDEPLFSSHLCQVARVAGLFGDRFLDQQMFALRQQIARDRKMHARRSGDRGSVNHSGELIERRCGFSFVLSTNFVCSCQINIENCDQFRIWQFGINARVIAANVTDTNDANAQFFHRRLTIDCT